MVDLEIWMTMDLVNQHLFIIDLPHSNPPALNTSHIQTYNRHEVKSLFREKFTEIQAETANAESLLQRLEHINRHIASRFTTKASFIPKLKFKLLFPSKFPKINRASYVALSYCSSVAGDNLHSNNIIGKNSQPSNDVFLPLSPELAQAVVLSLNSPNDGIWCDRICIDQQDPADRASSLSLMNVIYSSARYVAIALDDIEIEEDELSALVKYAPIFAQAYVKANGDRVTINECRSPPFMKSNPGLLSFYENVIRSKWFQRSWCSYEKRVGSMQSYFVRCKKGQGSTSRVLRIGGAFMEHLCFLYFPLLGFSNRVDAEMIVNASFTIPEPSTTPGTAMDFLETFSQINALKTGGNLLQDPKLREQSAMQDKLVITLNSTKSGLAITDDAYERTLNDLYHSDFLHETLTALALASGDPTVLCTSGRHLVQKDNKNKSWIALNHFGDRRAADIQNLNLDTSKMTFDSEDLAKYIELELHAASDEMSLTTASPNFQQLAQKLLAACFEIKPHFSVIHRYYDWISTLLLNHQLLYLSEQIIACILQAGILWLVECLPFTRRSFLYDQLGDVAERVLSTYATQPPKWLTEGDNPSTKTQISEWLNDPDAILASDFILQFVTYVIHQTLPRPWSAENMSSFRPHLITKGPDTNHSPLRVKYKSTYLILLERRIQSPMLTVPTVLLGDDYHDLKRVWLLEPDGKKDDRVKAPTAAGVSTHRLLGKQRIIGPSLNAGTGSLFSRKQRVRVLGPVGDITDVGKGKAKATLQVRK